MRPRLLLPLAGLGVLAVLPPILGQYASLVGCLAVIYSLVALGFVVLTGWTGDVSLGQIVPYGLGAYATFFLSHRVGLPVTLAVLAAPFLTLPFLVLIGLPTLRLRGLDLAVGTLAIALVGQLMLFRSLGEMLAGGGELARDARQFVPVGRPAIGPLHLSTNRALYFGVLGLGLVGYLLVTLIGRSATGRVLRAIRDDARRAEVMGIPVGRYRIGAFLIAGALAALAGALLATLRQAVTPPTFSVFESLNLLAIAIIGGLSTPRGAVLGGVLGAGLPELSRLELFRFLQGRLLVVYGASLVVLLVFRPGGVAGLLRWDRSAPPELPQDLDGDLSLPVRGDCAPTGRRSLVLFRMEAIDFAYGAQRVLDGISFTVGHGDSVALIGPNGAGKSTLIDVATGLLSPSGGRIFFDSRDITSLPCHRRAALGLGRTFQTARVFSGLTVSENLVAAAHGAHHPEREAARLVGHFDLERYRDTLPSHLPFGSVRMLEVAVAMAGAPRLILLDEPAAGLDPTDADRLCSLLKLLRATRELSILVVEHDMGFVRLLAERVVVLDRGCLIANGTPAEVAANPEVVASYLGETGERLAGGPVVQHA